MEHIEEPLERPRNGSSSSYPGDGQLSFFPEEQPPDPNEQRLVLFALSQIKGLGEASLKGLLSRFPDLNAVWKAPPAELQEALVGAGLRSWRSVVDEISDRRQELLVNARRTLDGFAERNIKLLLDLDLEYPKRLLETTDPPRWLFVEGDPVKLSMPNLVAVVGTRDPSREGISLARFTTAWLAKKDFGIVSGLADGIDQAAHKAALEHEGPTIGVMGTGILQSFPKAVGPLHKRIVAEGGGGEAVIGCGCRRR